MADTEDPDDDRFTWQFGDLVPDQATLDRAQEEYDAAHKVGSTGVSLGSLPARRRLEALRAMAKGHGGR